MNHDYDYKVNYDLKAEGGIARCTASLLLVGSTVAAGGPLQELVLGDGRKTGTSLIVCHPQDSFPVRRDGSKGMCHTHPGQT